jgi:hypothetical protein
MLISLLALSLSLRLRACNWYGGSKTYIPPLHLHYFPFASLLALHGLVYLQRRPHRGKPSSRRVAAVAVDDDGDSSRRLKGEDQTGARNNPAATSTTFAAGSTKPAMPWRTLCGDGQTGLMRLKLWSV